MEKFTNKNVSLVITPELELCLNLMSPSEGRELLKALTDTIRGEYVEMDDMYPASLQAYEFFTGPDYYIKDLILPRLSDPTRKTK